MSSSFEGFLPTDALVMVPKGAPQAPTNTAAAPAVEELAQELIKTTIEVPIVDSLETIRTELGDCQRCGLARGRKTIVFGEGNPDARLMLVGEGPGANEDIQGRPFVGNAGQLLDRMMQAIGLAREEVYICNVVKCRPPSNRNPEPDEITACSPFLLKQVGAVKPELILALGKFAAQTLLGVLTPISRLRGKIYPYQGTKLLPTFHPSYLLRNPSGKKDAWADLKLAATELGIEIPKRVQ